MAGAAFCKTTILRCIFNWDSKCPPLPPLLYSGGVDQFGCTAALCLASYRCVSGHIVLCHLCGHTQGLDDCNM